MSFFKDVLSKYMVSSVDSAVVKKEITQMLKRHPHVKSYRLGQYGEGGDGVTVVVLK